MKKSTKIKFLKIGMIVSGILTIIIAISDFIIEKFVKLVLKIDISANNATSVGIIGGADGPTTIVLAENQPFLSKYIWMLIFLVITLVCFLFWRKYSSID